MGAIVWLILGIIFLGYGFCIMAIRSGAFFFVTWFLMGLFCIIMSLGKKLGWWKHLPGMIKIIFGTIFIIGLVVLVIVEGAVLSKFGEKGANQIDYVIVLGAQVYEDKPSAVLRFRLDAAYDYLEKNPDTICIVSGGQGFNEPCPESQVMKKYLVKKGIDAKRIMEEDQSKNTSQNIHNSMQLFDAKKNSVGIVTNNFHLFRAMGIAKKQGIHDVNGIAAYSSTFYLPNNLFREFFGVMKDTIFGNMTW